MRDSKFAMRTALLILAAVVVAMSVKAWLQISESIPFNADEAVVALMARHILQGERPTFFYGQAYMGSLDAWLIAGAFNALGQEVWVIRLVQSLLYAGTMLTTAWLGKLVFESWTDGIIAAWLMAIPAVNVTLYTTATLGGYGEALLIGNIILCLAILLVRESPHLNLSRAMLWLVWGFLIGLGLWAFGLTLVYSLPAGVYVLISLRNRKDAESHLQSDDQAVDWCNSDCRSRFPAGIDAMVELCPRTWLRASAG